MLVGLYLIRLAPTLPPTDPPKPPTHAVLHCTALQSCFVAWSGVSESSREWGLVILVVGAAVHGLALEACIEGGVIFRDGQVRHPLWTDF